MWNTTKKRVLSLDAEEHGVVINALNELRTDLIEEQRDTEVVDDLLLKTIRAPTKKEKRRAAREER